MVFRDDSVLGRAVLWLAKMTAIAGGLVLLALIVLIIVSVTGRALIWAGLRPVMGDYELVSAGIGFAIFSFMPWAHFKRTHAIVTLVSDRFGALVNRWILVATDLMMLAASAFIAWRLYLGMLDKFAFRETTLLLRMPLGWAYAAALVGACVFVVVSVYVLGRSLTHAARGEDEVDGEGAHL